jgi:hypothetical protein
MVEELRLGGVNVSSIRDGTRLEITEQWNDTGENLN